MSLVAAFLIAVAGDMPPPAAPVAPPVESFALGQVLTHTLSVCLDNGARVTLRVVEILRGARVIGYFLTTSPVSAKLEITEPSKVVPGFKLERTT